MDSGVARRGRPVSENSARQLKLAAREQLIASGAEIKRGRPALPKIDAQ